MRRVGTGRAGDGRSVSNKNEYGTALQWWKGECTGEINIILPSSEVLVCWSWCCRRAEEKQLPIWPCCVCSSLVKDPLRVGISASECLRDSFTACRSGQPKWDCHCDLFSGASGKICASAKILADQTDLRETIRVPLPKPRLANAASRVRPFLAPD